MKKLYFSRKAVLYLSDLVEILYENDYFGFKEQAKNYVSELVRGVESTFDIAQKKKAPSYFTRYGQNLYYVSYPKNKHTTWYFFFTQKDEGYFVEYIGNNHNIGHLL